MSDVLAGQVTASAAEIYEEFFVPALFGEWAGRVADAARVGLGDVVLDVGCGTGVLARELAARCGPDGAVTGLDRNEAMLEVARARAPAISWRRGMAEDLPFADDGFDAAASQFALMFYEDRVAALSQMRRVVRPGGRIAVAVWGPLEAAPGYAAMVALLGELFGSDVAEGLSAPYVLGDRDTLRDLFARAGYGDVEIELRPGRARFPSLDDWIFTDIRGWTLSDLIDDERYRRLVAAATPRLAHFVAADGSVEFDHPALIASAVSG